VGVKAGKTNPLVLCVAFGFVGFFVRFVFFFFFFVCSCLPGCSKPQYYTNTNPCLQKNYLEGSRAKIKKQQCALAPGTSHTSEGQLTQILYRGKLFKEVMLHIAPGVNIVFLYPHNG
jgi:hypothetical protein